MRAACSCCCWWWSGQLSCESITLRERKLPAVTLTQAVECFKFIGATRMPVRPPRRGASSESARSPRRDRSFPSRKKAEARAGESKRPGGIRSGPWVPVAPAPVGLKSQNSQLQVASAPPHPAVNLSQKVAKPFPIYSGRPIWIARSGSALRRAQPTDACRCTAAQLHPGALPPVQLVAASTLWCLQLHSDRSDRQSQSSVVHGPIRSRARQWAVVEADTAARLDDCIRVACIRELAGTCRCVLLAGQQKPFMARGGCQ
jgi:hypothetical protein